MGDFAILTLYWELKGLCFLGASIAPLIENTMHVFDEDKRLSNEVMVFRFTVSDLFSIINHQFSY